MIQRGEDVVAQMLPDIKQNTIKTYIEYCIQPANTVYTDKYVIYANLMQLGYKYKIVNNSSREYRRKVLTCLSLENIPCKNNDIINIMYNIITTQIKP